jgi:hypothetical protein
MHVKGLIHNVCQTLKDKPAEFQMPKSGCWLTEDCWVPVGVLRLAEIGAMWYCKHIVNQKFIAERNSETCRSRIVNQNVFSFGIVNRGTILLLDCQLILQLWKLGKGGVDKKGSGSGNSGAKGKVLCHLLWKFGVCHVRWWITVFIYRYFYNVFLI